MINCCLTPLKMQRKIGDTEESFWEWKSWQRASANEGVGKISPQNVFYRSIFFTNKQMERSNAPLFKFKFHVARCWQKDK